MLLVTFHGFLTTSKYAKLAKCSTDAALRDIQELLDRGILVKKIRPRADHELPLGGAEVYLIPSHRETCAAYSVHASPNWRARRGSS